MTADGYVKTGDAGFFDSKTGHLKIIDRAKDVGKRNDVVYGSYQELAGHRLVYDMIQKNIEEMNRSLAEDKATAGVQVKRFLILHKELDADDGEITRTLKVRRGFVAERYATLVKALYDGSSEAD